MITGGHLKNIPLPHKHQWPGAERQREVRAQIVRYGGAGGRHYYASMEQESNPVWDTTDGTGWGNPGKPNGWTNCWDDEEGKGIFLSSRRFNSHIEATGWIGKMMTKHFPGHKLITNDYSGEYYAKYEGD